MFESSSYILNVHANPTFLATGLFLPSGFLPGFDELPAFDEGLPVGLPASLVATAGLAASGFLTFGFGVSRLPLGWPELGLPADLPADLPVDLPADGLTTGGRIGWLCFFFQSGFSGLAPASSHSFGRG